MRKQFYDHRTKLCAQCAFHRPEGKRENYITDRTWKEACGLFGYSFHPEWYEEDADDCEGFKTPAQYAREQEMKQRRNNGKG